jgi:hypothetical protein
MTTAKLLGIHMDRQQAMAMLKELVANNLVESSYVSISEKKPKDYQIQIKCDYNKLEIEAHAKKLGLTIQEDKEKKYLFIFKP